MRLHRLELRAFGPFAGDEHVDFDGLTAAGLFLLCGPTGAGKTSLLDAVCLALFGQVPGDRDKAKRLHSDHAAPGLGPRVVLEVTLRGRRLRVTRCPEWTRPKKRGSGEVKEHAKVLVEERVDGRWEQRSSRIDEAADFIGSLLGLTLTQFCQVALLPQGRFETFLRCGAQERHALLEKLFGTHRFRAVEEWLADHRRRLAATSARHAAAVDGVLERVAEVAGRDRPGDLTGEPSGDPSGDPSGEPAPEAALEWADALRRDTAARLVEAVQARDGADLAAKDARTRLEAARDLAQLQRRHSDALRRDAELRALADSTAHERRRLDRAALAAGVAPLLALHDSAARRLGAARRGLDAARAALRSGVAGAAGADVGCAAWSTLDDVGETTLDAAAAAVRHWQEEAARLDALLPLQARVGEIDDEIESIDARAVTLDSHLRQLDVEAEQRAGAQADLRAAHAAAVAALARLHPLRERAAHGQRVARAADRMPGLLAQRQALAAAREQRADEAQRARDAWLDLRQARLDGMAAELARDLAAGTPCPVCGSAEHPAPASEHAAVPADAEGAAEQSWRELEEQRQAAGEALAACEREVATVQATTDGVDPDTARDRLREVAEELADAEQTAARADTLSDRLVAVQAAVRDGDERRRVLEAERVQLQERRRLRAAERADLHERLEAAAGGHGTLTERLHHARAAGAALEQLLDALREQATAEQAYDDAADRLRAAVQQAGFDDEADARSACLSPTERGNVEALLRARADQAAQVRAVLEDARVAEAAAQPDVDLGPFEEASARAEQARDTAVGLERDLDHRARRLDALYDELAEALNAWRPVRADLTVAGRMAALCAGTSTDNRHRMRLSAYVLAARLEQVVAAANERLVQMSSGRYTLQHTVARGAGDRRGGLGLQVHDGWTGELRDPATLSGGESFYTSLALALGLADVVSHEAGGTEIDTLFVDEGFGSLDPDTLDEVMDVLDQLRSGGRAVGIVSHVADLRARVAAQVHVRKARTGSTLAPA